MTKTRIRAWLSSLSWPLLIVVAAAVFGTIFAVGVAAWYLARHMGWWTFGLLFLAAEVTNPVINSVTEEFRKVRKQRRRGNHR